jgi:hypothetical protein
MKTTVDISDQLFRQAKAAAEDSRTTMRQLIEDGLRAMLERKQAARKKPFRLGKLPTQGGGLCPGFEHATWQEMLDESYRGRGV